MMVVELKMHRSSEASDACSEICGNVSVKSGLGTSFQMDYGDEFAMHKC